MVAHVFPRRTTSTATAVTVNPAPGSSALWDTINASGGMAANSWRKHTTATNQDPAIGQDGTPESLTTYANSMPWNPIAKSIEIIGGGHPTSGGGNTKYARYAEVGDAFGTPADGFRRVHSTLSDTYGLVMTHGYDHSSVNPHTGDLYCLRYGGGVHNVLLYRKLNSSEHTFTQLSAGPSINSGVALGTCYWSGAFTPSGGGGIAAGAHGCCMIYFSNIHAVDGGPTNGWIIGYDPLSGSPWFYMQDSRAPGGGGNTVDLNYHMIMEYSPSKNVAVYGGGDTDLRELWKMTSTGAVTSMPAPTNPSQNITANETGGRLVNDPATGNFLLLSAGELWELNPDGAGSWRIRATVPDEVGNPNVQGDSRVVGVALPDHGVVAFITQNSQTGGTFWLYKNGA